MGRDEGRAGGGAGAAIGTASLVSVCAADDHGNGPEKLLHDATPHLRAGHRRTGPFK